MALARTDPPADQTGARVAPRAAGVRGFDRRPQEPDRERGRALLAVAEGAHDVASANAAEQAPRPAQRLAVPVPSRADWDEPEQVVLHEATCNDRTCASN